MRENVCGCVAGKENRTRVRVLWHDDQGQQQYQALEIDEGGYAEFESTSEQPLRVLSNHPVCLMQYAKSFQADDVRSSDPFMVTVPPVRQYQTSYFFHTFEAFDYKNNPFANFVSLTIDITFEQGLRLDNATLGDYIVQRWQDVDNTGYVALTLNISDGSHWLTHVDNATFGAVLYAYKFQESYGQSLGQRLLRFKEPPCTRTFIEEADLFDNDCDGEVDEEWVDGIDNDGDGNIDEDIMDHTATRPPTSTLLPTTVPSTTTAIPTTLTTAQKTTTTVVRQVRAIQYEVVSLYYIVFTFQRMTTSIKPANVAVTTEVLQ